MDDRNQPPRRAWWPDEQQLRLLRACFLEGDQAMAAWRDWSADHELADVDAETRGLLPVLYQNVHQQAGDDPAMGRLRGLAHYTWTANVVGLQKLMPLLTDLSQTVPDLTLLKGGMFPYFLDLPPGARSNGDFGLLIRPEQRAAGFALLERHGFRPARAVPPSRLALMSRLEFRGADGGGLTLYWHLLREGTFADPFVDRLETVTLNGLELKTLSAADHLLQVCADGLWTRPMPSLRWIADAVALLRSSRPLDWDRLVAQAQADRLTLTVGECLTYLVETFDADVPLEVLAALRAAPVSRLERLEYRLKTRPGVPYGGATGLLLMALRLRMAHSPLNLADLLQQWWGLDAAGQLPGSIALALRRQLGQRTSGWVV